MPNISISNYPSGHPDAPRRSPRKLAEEIRAACLSAHETIPVLGKWEGKDVAIALLGPNLFPNDNAPVQIVIEVLYENPARTPEVLKRFGKLLIASAKAVYPELVFEVTFRPLLNPANVVCSE